MKISYIIKLTPNDLFPDQKDEPPRYIVPPERTIEEPGFPTEDEAWGIYEILQKQAWEAEDYNSEISQWGLNWDAQSLKITTEVCT